MDWKPIETSPKNEGIHFLVLTPGNDYAPFVVLQVSNFQGFMYSDACEIGAIENATHWCELITPNECS